jgi:DNA-binding MarR family transcriptional regulator
MAQPAPRARAKANRTKSKPRDGRLERRSAVKLDANLSYRMSIITFLIGKLTQELYTVENLNSHEWKVLSVLNSFAPLPASEIARWVTLDRAAISRAVRRLLELGLATRFLSENDGRTVDIIPTAHGTQTYLRMTKKMSALQESILADLTEQEIDEFFAKLDAIEHRVRERLGPSAHLPPL